MAVTFPRGVANETPLEATITALKALCSLPPDDSTLVLSPTPANESRCQEDEANF